MIHLTGPALTGPVFLREPSWGRYTDPGILCPEPFLRGGRWEVVGRTGVTLAGAVSCLARPSSFRSSCCYWGFRQRPALGKEQATESKLGSLTRTSSCRELITASRCGFPITAAGKSSWCTLLPGEPGAAAACPGGTPSSSRPSSDNRLFCWVSFRNNMPIGVACSSNGNSWNFPSSRISSIQLR